MSKNTLAAGANFPSIKVKTLDDSDYILHQTSLDIDWKLIVVYRGVHCPLCTSYLNQIETIKNDLSDLGVRIVAVSADSKEQAKQHLESLDISYDLCYGLTLEQMRTLGLYISEPRSPEETDHPFSEPGLFIVNEHAQLQILEYANAPFIRPDLNSVVRGIKFIRNPENNYPIRGTFG